LYDHLRGKLIDVSSLGVVVETAGVGWQLQVPLSTSEQIRERRGSEVVLFTHLLVREDDLRLFGFVTRGERQAFRLLLSGSRTGPAIALQALSTCPVSELVGALEVGDIERLCRIKGIGKKLAERLVLELREKAALLARELCADGAPGELQRGRSGGGAERLLGLATAALAELGYPTRDAERRAEDAWEALSAAGPVVGVEAIIREALRRS